MTYSRAKHVIAMISFIAVGLSAKLVLADGAKLQIYLDQRAVVFYGISEKTVKELAKINGFGDPNNWPELRTTGHPTYYDKLPSGIIKLSKAHPEWQLKRLGESRVAFNDVGRERMVLLYRKKTSTLILLYYKKQYGKELKGDKQFRGIKTDTTNGSGSEKGPKHPVR